MTEKTKLNMPILVMASICLTGCGDSLNSQNGPESGTVTGLVCNDLPVLTAALEFPASKTALVSDGSCIELRNARQVDVIRTVMMPGDGKYSQFEISVRNSMKKMWIKTDRIRKKS